MASGLPDFYQQTVIAGLSGSGDYKTLVVDESGNIVCVICGEYQGSLETVAVDGAGRLKAVITDAQNPWNEEVTIGFEELASRLGANQRFDYRGRVVRASGFERGLGVAYLIPNDSSVSYSLSAKRPLHGGYCLLVELDGVGTDSLYVTLETYNRDSDLLGIEASYIPDGSAEFLYWGVRCRLGASYKEFAVRFDTAGEELQYLANDGSWEAFATDISLLTGSRAYHTGKLVCNQSTGLYERFLFELVEYDLSDYSCYPVGAVGNNYTDGYARIQSTNGSACSVYVDNIILTDNEPVNS